MDMVSKGGRSRIPAHIKEPRRRKGRFFWGVEEWDIGETWMDVDGRGWTWMGVDHEATKGSILSEGQARPVTARKPTGTRAFAGGLEGSQARDVRCASIPLRQSMCSDIGGSAIRRFTLGRLVREEARWDTLGDLRDGRAVHGFAAGRESKAAAGCRSPRGCARKR